LHTPESGHWSIVLGLALGTYLGIAPAHAQAVWSLDAAAERARVTLGARQVSWATNRVQLSARTAQATGWYVAAENQKRERDTDTELIGGAYGLSGPWLWSGQASLAANPGFLPRYSLEPQIGRQFGRIVVQGGAIYKKFADSRVRIGTLSMTGYRGDSELELKLVYGDSQPFDRRIRVATLRGLWDPGGAFSIGASFSTGQGIYDSVNVPGVRGNHGRVLNLNLQYRIDDAYSVRIGLTDGRENPSFRERRLGLSLRKIF
jgi:YaiO family outer membrane protein